MNPESHKSFMIIHDHNISIADLTLDVCGSYTPDGVDLSQYHVYWVARINVCPRMRGKGFGKQLMTEVCEWLDVNGFASVIGVSSYGEMNNDELQFFYEKFGFVFDSRQIGYRLPKIDVDVVLD